MQEGQILVGKYRVDRVLGVGGTGAVFAAHHLQLDTRVAIKFLRPSLLTNQEAVASFVREARAALQMHNEHVARVFDVGTLATGAPYMVMEFLDGADLGKLLQKRGPLAVEEAIEFVLQACEGLAEAHAVGIVHRDLKPTNLFCIRRPDGRPIIKVLDFGISEVVGLGVPRDQTPTSGAALMGSPLYMAPEQIDASQVVDARTDIWALGVILYELLSDRTPFSGDTLPEVSTKISLRAPQPLRDLMPHVPEALVAVIETCLQKDRQKRYPNVAALALALQPFGPRRARVSVDRITDMLQAAGLWTPEPSVQDAPAVPVQPMFPVSQQPAVGFAAAATHLGATAAAPGAGPVRRSAVGLLGVVLLGLLGVAVGAVTLAFFLQKGLVRLDREPVATVASPEDRGVGLKAITRTSRMVMAEPQQNGAPAPVPPRQLPRTVETSVISGASAVSTASAKSIKSARSATSATSATSASSDRSASLRVAGGNPTRDGVPGAAEARSGSASSQIDCNPGFTLDSQGRKHFKPECLAARAISVAAPPRQAPSCDPSFDLDQQGRKHFKPECFGNAKR